MTNWACAACRAQVSPGAPRCPQCPSTSFTKPEAEAEMLKIHRDGTVTDSADVEAAAAAAAAEANAVPEDGQAVTELPPPPPVSAPKAEHVSYAAEVLEVPVDEAEAMRKAELVQLARGAAAEAAEPQVPDAAPGPAPAVPPRVPPRLPPGGADG